MRHAVHVRRRRHLQLRNAPAGKRGIRLHDFQVPHVRGRITGCRDVGENADSRHGGAVYVAGTSRFCFSGGEITGNTSERAVGGVVLDRTGISNTQYATLYLGGNGKITGNRGPVGDNVYCGGNESIWILAGSSDVYGNQYTRAVVGVSTSIAQAEGVKTSLVTLQTKGRSYANTSNIFLDSDPSLVLDPDSYGDTYTSCWRKRVAKYIKANGEEQMLFSFTNAYERIGATSGTIEVYTDVELPTNWHSKVIGGVGLTIRGHKDDAAYEGERPVLKVADNWPVKTLFTVQSGGELVFENVVIDANKNAGVRVRQNSGGFIMCTSGSRLTLKKGGEIRNAMQSGNGGPAAYVNGDGSVFRMESGSFIRGCESSWGSGVCIIGSGAANQAKFEFTGGTITECNSHSSSSARGGNGGALYMLGGTLEMSGDALVISNVASTVVAGVQLYGTASEMYVSGRAGIYDNAGGGYSDLYLHSYKAGCLKYRGDFRGRISIRGGGTGGSAWDAVTGADARFRPDEGATGSWSFESYTGLPAGSDHLFGTLIGTVDGRGFTSLAQIEERLSLDEDVDSPNFHSCALTGEALNAQISQRLVFDPETLKTSGRLPVQLYSLPTGSSLALTPVFTYPASGHTKWRARVVNDGVWLDVVIPGTTVIFR